MKRIIINADDFGMSPVFNNTILNLLENNIVSSTSVMVNRITNNEDEQIKKLIKIYNKGQIAIGLHFEYENHNGKYEEIFESIENQYDKFIKILGVRPSHIDKHKNIYSDIEARVMVDFARVKNLVIRNSQSGRIKQFKENLNMPNLSFSLTHHSFEELLCFVNSMQDEQIAEIISHPGKFDSNCKSSLNKEREIDLKNLVKFHEKLKELNVSIINSLWMKNK